MGQIVDSVAIKIKGRSIVPEIPHPFERPLIARNVGSTGFDRMKIMRENIFGKAIPLRVRTEAQTDITPSDAIAYDLVLVALVEREANRIFGDLIPFQAAVVR